MRQPDMFGNAGLPFEAWNQMWLGAFGNAQKSLEPASNGAVTAQKELLDFATRRSQAWLALPTELAACKAPQDLAQASTRFWQSATSDWTAASQRMMTVWTSALPTGTGLTSARDHVTLQDAPETKRGETGSRAGDRQDPNGRRAAA